MTPKQRLRAHIEGMHRNVPKSWTLAKMQEWHVRQHHRYALSHDHVRPSHDLATLAEKADTGEAGA